MNHRATGYIKPRNSSSPNLLPFFINYHGRRLQASDRGALGSARVPPGNRQEEPEEKKQEPQPWSYSASKEPWKWFRGVFRRSAYDSRRGQGGEEWDLF